MHNANREQLIAAARLLRPLLDELVFVGGCATGLLIDEEAAPSVRPTYDVDAIAEITSYAAYASFSARLRQPGFVEDTREGAPVCRWLQDRTTLDVMPLAEDVFGFSNRWYAAAMKTAAAFELEPKLTIRLVTAPCFVATKLEAFRKRGRNDFLGSRDLDDVMSVVDGRPGLVSEIEAQSAELRRYIRAEFGRLLRSTRFLDALPGFLPPDAASQARIGIVMARMEELARS